MQRKIELKGTKVVFTTKTDELERVETVPKIKAIELYKQTKDEKVHYMAELNKLNKKIQDSKIEPDKELDKFIEMANKAHQYNEFKKATEQRDGALNMINNINQQIEDLEKAIPELKRAKK